MSNAHSVPLELTYCKSVAPVELWVMVNAWLKQLEVV